MVFLAVFIATGIVLIFLIALGRISLGAALIIFAIIIFIFLLLLSLFGAVGTFLKVAAFLLVIAIAIAAISYCTASGLTSLFWWLNKDTTPIEKEKRKICPGCGAENMLGRLFCVKCSKRLLFTTNVIKNLRIFRETASERKTSEKPEEKVSSEGEKPGKGI